ncbi:hypothetical protein WICPIJ_007010 [Wickerhamomyces pijperi]|uniref:Uncharacterized protein n=1 Tax=Wickerhamomyces pijperi TaxID=599730 RepID=A0A9P8Q0N8_WICPI|nr:hypothetical protein WICPIJ_007010 [Wickerhamomyces pijperi]
MIESFPSGDFRSDVPADHETALMATVDCDFPFKKAHTPKLTLATINQHLRNPHLSALKSPANQIALPRDKSYNTMKDLDYYFPYDYNNLKVVYEHDELYLHSEAHDKAVEVPKLTPFSSPNNPTTVGLVLPHCYGSNEDHYWHKMVKPTQQSPTLAKITQHVGYDPSTNTKRISFEESDGRQKRRRL